MVTGIAFIVAAMGMYVTSANIYIVFLYRPLHQLRHGKEPERNISVVPVFGSLFLWIAAALCWWVHQPHWAHGLLVLSLFDMGGLHWFLIFLLYIFLQGVLVSIKILIDARLS